MNENEKRIVENWEAIVDLMNDDYREQVHAELAPCTEIEFLKRYAELDPEIEFALAFSWNIEI